MALFARGLPRLAVLFVALAAFCLIPPEFLARGPDLCVWRHLLHVAACPACGSTRALAAFFHGRLRQALGYNRNVILTGPGLLILIVMDCAGLARKLLRPRREAPEAA
jgi:Protein of unknown function (DUF2752)